MLLTGGRVIDPKNGVDDILDVLIRDGKVSEIGKSVVCTPGTQIVDVSGCLVVPGLVDIHTHLFCGPEHSTPESGNNYSNAWDSLAPDSWCPRSGVTTAVDAGGAGWKNFKQFKDQVISRSKTRVLAFLNIVGSGMKGEQIVEQNVSDMNGGMTATVIKRYEEIVGIKCAHFYGDDWKHIIEGVKAADDADVPIMVHLPTNLEYRKLMVEHLRPGDIITHQYANDFGKMIQKRQTLFDEEKNKPRPYIDEARKRGVLFDVGHGRGSFYFSQAIPAINAGFGPDSISTDLHRYSASHGMKDFSNVMSKFLAMGLSVGEVIDKSTWKPAQFIKRTDLGHLSVGATADVAVFKIHTGDYGFVDCAGYKIDGKQKLECQLTLVGGEMVYDLNGLTAPFSKQKDLISKL